MNHVDIASKELHSKKPNENHPFFQYAQSLFDHLKDTKCPQHPFRFKPYHAHMHTKSRKVTIL